MCRSVWLYFYFYFYCYFYFYSFLLGFPNLTGCVCVYARLSPCNVSSTSLFLLFLFLLFLFPSSSSSHRLLPSKRLDGRETS